MMRDLGYIIKLNEAVRIKDHIALTLNIWGLDTENRTLNHSTYKIEHPNLDKQFGAIYLAGDNIDVIKYNDAVKFIEVRFFVDKLELLNKYEEFQKIKVKFSSLINVKEDKILKFQFFEPNMDLINDLLHDIHSALFTFDS